MLKLRLILIVVLVYNFLNITHASLHTYYNPTTNTTIELLQGEAPHGYFLVRPPYKAQLIVQPLKSQPDTDSTECEKNAFSCTTKFKKSFTRKFNCNRHAQCPENFVCCTHRCFSHKICVKSSSTPSPARKMDERTTTAAVKHRKYPKQMKNKKPKTINITTTPKLKKNKSTRSNKKVKKEHKEILEVPAN